MPIYEYYCARCHVRYNSLQKIDAPAPACPRCGNVEVKKLVSGAAVLHSDQEHKERYRSRQEQIDTTDKKALARFFREHGGELSERMDGQLTTSEAFQDLLNRVDRGATEADMKDIEDALAEATNSPYKMGYHSPEPAQSRLVAQEASRAGKMTEEDRQREADRLAGPGHQFKKEHPDEIDSGDDEHHDDNEPPKSPWSSPNIGWTS